MKIHRLQGYIQNIYLVEEAHGLLLLDGCSRADVDNVCGFIAKLGRDITELRCIVVTHMHPDHAGGAHKLRKLSGATLVSHPKAKNWYAGPVGRMAHFIDVLLTWWVAGRIGKRKRHIWYSPVLKPDKVLKDGATLPRFDNWQVVYTPGHTDHDLSVVHVPTQEAYVADLIVKVKGELVPPYPVCHPNQYRRSLKRVSDMALSRIFCAHVPPLDADDINFEAVLAQAPTQPKNHWHSTKNRLKQKLGLGDKEH